MLRFTVIMFLSLLGTGGALAGSSSVSKLNALKAAYLKAGGAEKPFAQLACFLRKNARAVSRESGARKCALRS